MDKIKKLLGIYIAFLIQSLLFENIKIFSVSPDILLACVILFAVTENFRYASFLGAFAGLLKDALYSSVFGINTLLYMYLALFVSLTADEKNGNSPLIMSWILFVAVSAFEIVTALLKETAGYGLKMGALGANIATKGVFAALFAFVCVLISQKALSRGKGAQSKKKEENV